MKEFKISRQTCDTRLLDKDKDKVKEKDKNKDKDQDKGRIWRAKTRTEIREKDGKGV